MIVCTCIIINIIYIRLNIRYKTAIYYLYNSLIHELHISNFIFHELSMQLIIELLLTFNRSKKPTSRFLTKISKISMLLTAFCVLPALLLGGNHNMTMTMTMHMK